MYLPDDKLREWVKVIWFLEQDGKEKMEEKIIMPDGCVCLTFVLTNHTENSFCYGSTLEYGIYISPPSMQKYETALNDELYAVDVTLYPGVFFNLFGIPITAMEHRMYNIKELSLKFDESILEKLIRYKGNVELSLNCLNDFLYKLFNQRFHPDALLLSTSDLVKKGDLDHFYLQQSLSTRQIQRKIKESTGLNPNTIHRINRFYNSLKYIKQNEFNPQFSQIALNNQFTDQSHFIKEFKFFSGKTPKEFLLNSQDYLQYNCNVYC